MKGVSEVISIILVLMIVIALAALAYTWFSGVFSGLTSTAGTSITQTTGEMATAFKIDSVTWNSGAGKLTIAIRNVGMQSFNISGTSPGGVLGIYIDNSFVTPMTWSVTGGPGCTYVATNGNILDKGCAGYLQNGGSLAGWVNCPTCPGTCTNTTKVSLSSGQVYSQVITC